MGKQWKDRIQELNLWLLVLIVVMVINVWGLARVFGFSSPLIVGVDAVRSSALALGDYYAKQAKESDLEQNTAFRSALANYRFEVEQAVGEKAVIQAVVEHGYAVAQTMERELQLRREQIALDIVAEEGHFTVTSNEALIVLQPTGTGLAVGNAGGILSDSTVQKLETDAELQRLTEPIQIQIQDGRPRLCTLDSRAGQIQLLRQELKQVETALSGAKAAAGLAELTGPGLLITAAPGRSQAVLDDIIGYDLRDIVNELFAAGAKGIQIGPERLIATSSIRSVGDDVLINHRTVALNPLEIKVVGESNVLASALDLIKSTPYFSLVLDIAGKDSITLNAHP